MESAQGIGVGTIVADTYEITSLLGKGGMGAVWAAQHRRLPGKRVAIKVLLTDAAGEAYLRFRREAEIASRIGHPNIVEVLDFNTLPSGEPYLVLELLEGESLASRLRRGALPLKTALDVARQIGSALHAAHRMSVVHRDLKPDNVFLCPRDVDGELRDQIKVLDFGISKIRGSQTVMTQDAVLVGTPQYMSPEQATGKNTLIDQRTDVFALGAITYEMLSGRAPFSGESLATLIFQVVYEKHPALAPLVPGAPASVIAAVDRALAKNADERFPDMNAFITALTGRPLMDAASLAGAVRASAAASAVRSEAAFLATAAPGSEAAVLATAAPGGAQPVAPAGVDVMAGTVAPGSSTAAPASMAPIAVAVTQPPPAKAGRSRLPLAVAIAAVLLGGGGVVAWKLAQPGQTPAPGAGNTTPATVSATPPGATATPPTASSTPPAAGPTPQPGEHAAAATPPAADAGVIAAPAVTGGKSPDSVEALLKDLRETGGKLKSGSGAPRKAEALPPEVAQELDAAEASLKSGNAREALRAADHSLLTARSMRAYSIKTRARCAQGDLGGAKAELQHVTGAERARVLRDCKAAGLEL